ncbi:MAG: S8 family serine peptidase [Nitrosopumilus sp.]|nr:S8 family serine peptidase [Nitrosopumilus sp.]MDA7999650.1 S8 family serine peptidase [Nitrosopumilus sp.]
MKRLLLLGFLVAALPAIVYAQTTGDQFTDPAVPDIIPQDDSMGPVANTVAEFKFDDGFYEKISRIMEEPPLPGDPGVHDGTRYYDVIVVVGRGAGDVQDPDEIARKNKAALVERLGHLGARQIVAAESLSFVTASIPVAEIPGFSLHDEVYKMGDGELEVVPQADTARETIMATAPDISVPGRVLDGSGVKVAVIDLGVYHTNAFGDRVLNSVTCRSGSCVDYSAHVSAALQYSITHGTRVAQVLAASGLPAHNGIAPGVYLMDVDHSNDISSANFAHTIDWSLSNGADIVNLSLGLGSCSRGDTSVSDLITNEAVDKGMVLVVAAGNANMGSSTTQYNSITRPGCSPNVITVGAIDDRNPTIKMGDLAGRGPATSDKLLKPDIVAPGVNLQALASPLKTNTVPASGTSYSAPQVSAAASLLLDAKPELTPLQIRSAILLGASWQGPYCTSVTYETRNTHDPCSHKRQPTDKAASNNAASLKILNNVGFGILDVKQSLKYATSSKTHIATGHLDSDESTKQYQFTVDRGDTDKIKLILSWQVHPHGNVTSQAERNIVVPIADLDFVTKDSGNKVLAAASSSSNKQFNEFAVFAPPPAGTYTVTVSGSDIDDLNKPFQTFTLASTMPLTEVSSRSNTPPTGVAQDIVAGPGDMPRVVRLTSADPDNEPRSYHISKDPTKGVLSVDEVITKSTSRALYTPNIPFTGDTFEITPYDGKATGDPITVRVRAENLPTGATEGTAMPDAVSEDKIDITGEARYTKYTKSFGAKTDPVHHIRVGSNNMEGVVAEITAGSETYRIAVPAGGSRIIDLASPLQVSSAKLTAWAEEEAVYDFNNMDPTTINAYIQYGGPLCPGAGGSAQVSCRAPGVIGPPTVPTMIFFDDFESGDGKWDETGEGDWRIVTSGTQYVPLAPGNTPNNHVMHADDSDTISTITMSDPVDLTRYPGAELTFERFVSSNLDRGEYLKAEVYDGSEWDTIYHWTHGSGDDSKWHEESYDLASYLGVDDFKVRFVARMTIYNEDVQIDDVKISPKEKLRPAESMSDDFESGLDKWRNSGGWTTSTSPEHYVSVVPGHSTANKVLHIDDCPGGCTIEIHPPVNLTSAPNPVLKFWRFVDYSLDSGEYLKAEVYDGSEWDTIYHWTHGSGDDHKWHSHSFDLGEYRVEDFKVRFVAKMSRTSEDVQIDNLEISRVGGTSAPIVDPTVPKPAGTYVPPPSPYSIYVSNTDDGQVRAYSPTGTYLGLAVPTHASDRPWDVAFDSDNNIYVADFANNKIRKYDGSSGREINRDWASTQFSPSSLVWNNDILYVGTAGGVERFSATNPPPNPPTGSPLGAFGDARERPSDSSTPRLYSAFDVLFAHERMYVSDKSLNKVYYYDAKDGRYLGKIPDTGSPAPLVTRPHGLEYGGAAVLYQAATSSNRVNTINTSTGSLIEAITSLVDNPHGIDADADGNVFVANRDDDNILKITRTGTVSALISDRALDDPRGVTIGPVYSRPSAGTAGFDLGDPPNDSPDFEVLLDGAPVYGVIPVSSAVTLEVRAVDAEDDPITIALDPGHIPDDEAISITDHGDGTASITLDPEGIPSGMYKFVVTVSDPENEEVSLYVVDIR